MFGRLIPSTLRPATRSLTHRASVLCAGSQHRLYTSDKDQNKTTGSSHPAASRQQPPKNSLEGLLHDLVKKPDLLSTSSTPAGVDKTGEFRSYLHDGDALKGDATGFTGSGRYGSYAGGHRMAAAEEDESNPMRMLILHVHASSNNTILSLTDANGKVLINASGGTVGFRKAQRAGFEAAYQATASIAAKIKERGIEVRKLEIRLKGFGAGRDAAFKAVHSLTNWAVCRVVDTTPIPFNGCRPKKARRL
ncbi:hypothetical protein GGI15_001276 [Coemansia interrupta]|uniref:Translational machinery component n=1 Tax=Coemansia interrupta TaxID=1126814 RepID=A0A9W8HLL5_9FUNG|nr:hypothetical protein GGI15_001276 [Coemansia interrupta]